MNIDPNKHYTVTEIANNNFLGVKDVRSVKKIINTDQWTNNYLKASQFGIGKRSLWQVLGRNIINYKAQKDDYRNSN